MKVVYKYPITRSTTFSLSLPLNSKIIHVDVQNDEAYFWALVDPNLPVVMRSFLLVGTGHQIIPDNVEHRGTFLVSGGIFVFHLFEQI